MNDDLRLDVDLNAIAAAFESVADAVLPATAAALYEEGERIMATSRAAFVPVRDGILRGSGFVDQPVINGDEVYVTLGYGGSASAYALVQHERTDFHHTVGQDHYLSEPVAAAAAGLPQRIGERVVEFLRHLLR